MGVGLVGCHGSDDGTADRQHLDEAILANHDGRSATLPCADQLAAIAAGLTLGASHDHWGGSSSTLPRAGTAASSKMSWAGANSPTGSFPVAQARAVWPPGFRKETDEGRGGRLRRAAVDVEPDSGGGVLLLVLSLLDVLLLLLQCGRQWWRHVRGTRWYRTGGRSRHRLTQQGLAWRAPV